LSPHSFSIVTAASTPIHLLISEKRSETLLQTSPRCVGPIGNVAADVSAMCWTDRKRCCRRLAIRRTDRKRCCRRLARVCRSPRPVHRRW
jgi:hypothetical protein